MNLPELVHECMCLMCGRYPGEPVDAAFIFGRAVHDYERGYGDAGILELAAELYEAGLARCIAIPGWEGSFTRDGVRVPTGWPGKSEWIRRLVSLGVLTESIKYGSDPGAVLRHTGHDSDELVSLAKMHGWQTVVALMNPHQLLRAMLGLLGSFQRCGYRLRVTPLCPQSVSWTKLVYGSQGAVELPRSRHIREEWNRVLTYQVQGDFPLPSLAELRAYLLEKI